MQTNQVKSYDLDAIISIGHATNPGK